MSKEPNYKQFLINVFFFLKNLCLTMILCFDHNTNVGSRSLLLIPKLRDEHLPLLPRCTYVDLTRQSQLLCIMCPSFYLSNVYSLAICVRCLVLYIPRPLTGTFQSRPVQARLACTHELNFHSQLSRQ